MELGMDISKKQRYAFIIWLIEVTYNSYVLCDLSWESIFCLYASNVQKNLDCYVAGY